MEPSSIDLTDELLSVSDFDFYKAGPTMKPLLEFPLERGGSIAIEVGDVQTEEGLELAARPGQVVVQAAHTLEEALDNIKPAAEAILSHLSALSITPNEVEVTFSLKATATAGMVIASGTLEANYVVKLKWDGSKKSDVSPS